MLVGVPPGSSTRRSTRKTVERAVENDVVRCERGTSLEVWSYPRCANANAARRKERVTHRPATPDWRAADWPGAGKSACLAPSQASSLTSTALLDIPLRPLHLIQARCRGILPFYTRYVLPPWSVHCLCRTSTSSGSSTSSSSKIHRPTLKKAEVYLNVDPTVANPNFLYKTPHKRMVDAKIQCATRSAPRIRMYANTA